MLASSLTLAALLVSDVGFNGFASTRAQFTAPSEESLLSTKDRPMLADLNELNVQGRASLLDEKLRFGLDVSGFVLFAGMYADADRVTGALRTIDDDERGDDVDEQATAFATLSELWVSAEPVEHLVLTAGKKRTVWGPGFAFSPTDLLNPLRDPTDPSLQRAGFVHARIDVPFEKFTATALVAPQVLEEQDGIPTRLLVDTDDELHWAAALRGYALIGDADVNAWLLWTHRYNDAFEHKPRLALTLSKSLFDIHEFHAEVLLQQGSARGTVNPDCVTSQQALGACALGGTPVVENDLLEDDFVYPDILVGWRTMPEDGSMFVVEYLYQADGFLRSEFDDAMRLAAFAGRFQREGLDFAPPSTSAAGSVPAGGVPNRVSFNPQRRHYLFLSYTKPQVLDDFTLSGTLITPLEDLSSLLSGSVQWQAQEWLSLSLFGFVPLPSPARISADLDGDPLQALYDEVDPDWRGFVPRGALIKGVPTGEFDAAPFDSMWMLEVKAYF